MGCEDMDLRVLHLAQDRVPLPDLTNTVMNFGLEEVCCQAVLLLASLEGLLLGILAADKTPWLWSASELYRPSDSRLSAKLVPTFADRCRVVSATASHGH
jgi:hypothetical protein